MDWEKCTAAGAGYARPFFFSRFLAWFSRWMKKNPPAARNAPNAATVRNAYHILSIDRSLITLSFQYMRRFPTTQLQAESCLQTNASSADRRRTNREFQKPAIAMQS